jgi:uncharacterized protein (DUF433 family)
MGMATIWEGCEEVEQVPGKMGGRPVIKGTRIEPETILTNAERGASPEETHESFPTVPLAAIRRIVEFTEHKMLVL